MIPSFQIATPVTAAANPSSGMATVYHKIMVINSLRSFENQSNANAVDEYANVISHFKNSRICRLSEDECGKDVKEGISNSFMAEKSDAIGHIVDI